MYIQVLSNACKYIIVTCKLTTKGSSQEITGCGIGALNGLHVCNVFFVLFVFVFVFVFYYTIGLHLCVSLSVDM